MTPKTLEEWKRNQYFPDRPSLMEAIDLTAAEILRVAEEYVDDRSVKDLQAGWLTIEGALMTQVRLDFLDYLKQFINSTNTEGGE